MLWGRCWLRTCRCLEPCVGWIGQSRLWPGTGPVRTNARHIQQQSRVKENITQEKKVHGLKNHVQLCNSVTLQDGVNNAFGFLSLFIPLLFRKSAE